MHSKKEIPTVPLNRFLKHSLEILKNPLPFHRQNFNEKGDIFRLKIGFNNEVFFTRDTAFAQYVLQKNQKNYVKSKIQTVDLVKYVGEGLLTSEGEKWKKQRKMMQPAFHNYLYCLSRSVACFGSPVDYPLRCPFRIFSMRLRHMFRKGAISV